jgi:hypothetical protein
MMHVITCFPPQASFASLSISDCDIAPAAAERKQTNKPLLATNPRFVPTARDDQIHQATTVASDGALQAHQLAAGA